MVAPLEQERVMNQYPTNGSLIDRTHKMWQCRPRNLTVEQIALDTGLTESWLYSFAGRKAQDFGIRKVERLYDYLFHVENTKAAAR